MSMIIYVDCILRSFELMGIHTIYFKYLYIYIYIYIYIFMAKGASGPAYVMKGVRPGERLGSMECTTLEGDSDR